MTQYFIPAAVFLSFLILVSPDKLRYRYTLSLCLAICFFTSLPALGELSMMFSGRDTVISGIPHSLISSTLSLSLGRYGALDFLIDPLSAVFILVTNFTVLTGLIYSRGYLRKYQGIKSPAQFSLHYFSYTWLHLSMLAVLTLRDGLAFLIAWELMAVSSFMLILFEAEKRATLKTAVNYLVQMHIGFVILLAAFLVAWAGTGILGFDALQPWFSMHANTGLFLLFFAGFAVKAGFIPFHTWLPEAHPAAPSHVSGVMSGVMIKMGIYGMFRVMFSLQQGWYTTGIILLVISGATAVYGILNSAVQKDLKKILAYSTIENIGLIGTGMGIGCLGVALDRPVMILLGFSGSLLHIINHSLFKSMLFYGAGSVYSITHTRNIDEMGGLVHHAPRTAALFLFGSAAICALPPLNGFVSEFLLFAGLFGGLGAGSAYLSILLILAIISLAVAGGLAIFSFSRAFGITFLGSLRGSLHLRPESVTPGMLFPKLMAAAVILSIGLLPALFVSPLAVLVSSQFGLDASHILSFLPVLEKIGMSGLILLLLVSAFLFLRMWLMRNRSVEYGPTWGCGFTAGSPRQQYTGDSFSGNLSELAGPLLQNREEYREVDPLDIFPARRSQRTLTSDLFGRITGGITDASWLVLKKLARLQTGNIRHYVLYAFLFMIAIFALMYLKLI
jgi:formate hydrogenlyase subunit 3/multisubunit Na+/H+ antiporter MnhD subunit